MRTRDQASKSQFVSTENMKQNCSGIEPYTEDDILIANIRPYLKKAWLASFSGICSADVLAIHPMKVDSAFLYSAISRDSFFTYVMSGVKGSKMPRGDKSHIMDFPLAIPVIEEQEKIARFVQCLNKRIEKQRQLVEALKSYKRGLIQRVFSGKTTGKMTNNDWKTVPISDLFSNIIDKGYPEGTVLTIIQGYGTTPRDSIERRISYDSSSVSSYKKVIKNDFILHLRSFEGGLEISNHDGIVSPAYTILRSKNTIAPAFYYAYFRSYEFIENKLRIAVEGIRDGKSINMDTFWKIHIPFPALKVQQFYANLFSSFEHTIEKANLVLTELENAKKSLLQQLFI